MFAWNQWNVCIYAKVFFLFLYQLSITFDWYFLTGTSSAIALESNLFFMSLFTATVLNLKCCNYDWNYSWNIIDIFIEFPKRQSDWTEQTERRRTKGVLGILYHTQLSRYYYNVFYHCPFICIYVIVVYIFKL